MHRRRRRHHHHQQQQQQQLNHSSRYSSIVDPANILKEIASTGP